MRSPRFAARVEVALPVPVESAFSYGVPADLAAIAEPGRRVVVPFGARRMTGLIVERRDGDPGSSEGLRTLLRVIDTRSVVSPEMIRIVRDAADEVFCPIGLALACATPSGTAPRTARGFAATPRGREALARGALRADAREIVSFVADEARTARAIERRLPGSGPLVRTLCRDGILAATSVAGREVRPPSLRVVELAPGVDGETAAARLPRAPQQAAVLRRLASRGTLPTAELGRAIPGAGRALRALAGKGLVRVGRRATSPARPNPALAAGEETAPRLTPHQETAFGLVAAAVRARRFERFLLHGVTGSGKTEVYLRAAAETLELGRQVLVLVPEITLTHQLVARLHARFGEQVAVLHSGLRPGERLGEWQRLLSGTTPIAVGARSALFAPLDDLGLIVIDEEHDGAYKNEEGFRYHARDLATRRAAAAGCPLVLGSATPALETRHAAERGELQRLVLPHRIGGRPLPAVEIVDLGKERALLPRGRKLVLSRRLQAALREVLAEGGQAILFLNRRGFSTRIFCFDCGHAERCRHCDISLVYHAAERCLRCHYCDYRIPPPEVCSGCGAPDTALLGLGTERLEEEVRRLFPEARVARLDRDAARRRGETERVLAALRGERLDVLIGTQMVAKGHDFPGVRLVGVVAADLALQLPDFRAAERTFQLLTQVAGRAGRRSLPGLVVVQTFAPDHYAIRPVRDHDYEAFYREELAHRAALGYPPFGRLIHVLVSSADPEAALEAATRLADRARRAAGDGGGEPTGIEVLGPAPAPLARLRDRYRIQLLVKGSDEKRVLAIGRELTRATARDDRSVRVQVDPNPLNML
jgi:primosomal protein N' (replication factor Y) (superfamily II helicase)